MAKRPTFSFSGLVDPDIEPTAVPGVAQRGAATVPEPAPEPTPGTARRRGRPPKARTATEARSSFGLDPETHRRFRLWLLGQGMSMQDYLEAHITALVQDPED